MIEETATVVAATPEFIWVEAQARSACSSCGTQGSCSTASVAKLFGMRRQQLRLPNTLAAKLGDKVVIGVADQVMVKASLAAYVLPVVLMLGAAIVADLQGMGDTQQVGVALLGLLLGLLGAGVLTSNRRMNRYFQPQLLRKITPHPLSLKGRGGTRDILSPSPLEGEGLG
ncbi:MAG TPA: SoxR reducing system RseC family protein [Candidatus Thiothrix moscowensis]|uniref:SoxR reducing system RseC family protein n=1 Tax=unclassified Thiothrix TaxID=2636184 RepID=UPI0025D46167|nr:MULTISPECIES: SoxR reducing system RseC family protein [unclassified Thiothrix]HRJ54534.1 SoxR reducing system RseC family protein [Candidatus Thiothrix moscowensis]HRJ94898.1 SoxR reducing system RseC family protein [Candidatus Thiothrix moscowensis]